MKRNRTINEATEESIADLEEYISDINKDIQSLYQRIGTIRAMIKEKSAPKQTAPRQPAPGIGQPFKPQQGQYVKIGSTPDGKVIVKDNTGKTFIVDSSGRATPINNIPGAGNQGTFDPNHNHPVGGQQEEKKGNWFTGTVGGAFDGLGQILSMPGHAISGLGRGLVSENEQPKKKFRIIKK